MRVLAFDCSGQSCAVALCDDGAVLARQDALMARGHADRLIPMIEEVRTTAGLDWSALDLLVVTVGPGTFTGVRIGLAAARALALASGLPLAGISVPEAMAAALPPDDRRGQTVLVAVDGKRTDVFVQSFDAQGQALDGITAQLPEEIAARLGDGTGLLLTGDGLALLDGVLPQACRSPLAGPVDPVVLARLGQQRFAAGTALPPQPLYLRAPDVTLSADAAAARSAGPGVSPSGFSASCSKEEGSCSL